MTDVIDPRSEDQLLQATCESIVTAAAKAIDAEPAGKASNLRLPEGPMVGRQITIDATEKDGPANICRLSVMDPALAPAGEVVRIEYEHDKQGKFGLQRVYSIQSVRQKAGELVLMENFLAESASQVREADFRPIHSEAYAQETVLKTLEDWTRYRAWQLQEARKK
jgi:hypothetical protein